jgi:Leucine-rich repeat (LRR) protein
MLYSKLSSILPELTHLILEGNEIGDESCRIICQLCTKLHYHLAVLNLSKCSITDVGAEYVANLLKLEGSKIKALLLHWNKIMGRGAGLIARAIEENSALRIFDASFNSFGSSPLYVKTRQSQKKLENGPPIDLVASLSGYSISAHQWSRCLMFNKTLVHLDLSFNNVKTPDIQLMGEALK